MTSREDFGRESRATDVVKVFEPSLKGRTVLVTGCSLEGIGEATVQALAKGGAGFLILAGRSQSKLDAVIATLDTSRTKIRTLILDLSSQKSVKRAAEEVNAYEEEIDILINNAAAFGLPERQVTEEGLELMLGTNHIGHFLFTNLILGKLKAAAKKSEAKTRIVNVTSLACMSCPFRFSDYNWEGKDVPPEESVNWDMLIAFGVTPVSGYQMTAAYAQSKTANVLFTIELNKRLLDTTGIESFAVHPGFVASAAAIPVFENLPEDFKKTPMFYVKDLDQGSSTTLVAALDPKLSPVGSQIFLSDCQLFPVAPFITDPDSATRLWNLSETIVEEKFGL